MRFKLTTYPLLGLVLLIAASPTYGQVTLAPTFVYVESPASYGTVMLTNTSQYVQEVFVEFEFGYPAADDDGRRYLEYDDAASEARFSLSPWIRSFPEQIRIPPKHRQLVRLMIDPTNDLDGGIYWTRMVVTSREEQSMPGGAAAQVNFEFKQIIPIVFDNGAATTVVEVSDLLVDAEAHRVHLAALLERTGDEPFFGTIDLRILDLDGREVERVSTKTDAYFRSSTYFTIDRRSLPAGDYVAEVSVRSERGDVRSGEVPPMAPVSRRFAIHIPEPGALTFDTP